MCVVVCTGSKAAATISAGETSVRPTWLVSTQGGESERVTKKTGCKARESELLLQFRGWDRTGIEEEEEDSRTSRRRSHFPTQHKVTNPVVSGLDFEKGACFTPFDFASYLSHFRSFDVILD